MARSSLLMAIGLVLALMAAAGCIGDDDGDRNDDGSDEGVGPRDPAEGQFSLLQIDRRDRYVDMQYTRAFGSIMISRPRYERLEIQEGACRLWIWDSVWCEECGPFAPCSAEGECVEEPPSLSAGTIRIAVNGSHALEMYFGGVGYGGALLPDGLFGAGDRLTLRAVGGPDVPGFTLGALMQHPPAIELERFGEENRESAVVLRDGQDLVVAWSPAIPSTRVRLELPTNSRGHGTPPTGFIECEADDRGSIVVPRSIVEAFPEKLATEEEFCLDPEGTDCWALCPGATDCPPATVTRFRTDSIEIDGMKIELVVGGQRAFDVFHPR